MYAHLIASGICRSWSEARHEMDLPTLAALNRYWEHTPPVHVLVARYLGFKAPTGSSAASAPSASQSEPIEDLIQLIQSGAL